ncbi:hypothetical protein CONPUDRAFT_147884 [Coniophora puteana RWD-64-598 SS2]|uniref:Uncharacterized protein n=1 Tax=Coniophora puteana (strain RWD-64-598) TaxID=741705 RepID=R7SEL6_CONPW|nr:uncharacterized protein CONPUDRAFT_147884 [Coniophora puteana RWD-64-598 SS2]EIW74295.1 hypothetical protein CONPUDRAFT_147884 [Coniophora puteana RWD-64-598 SS2]
MSNHQSDELNPSNTHPIDTRQLSAAPHSQTHPAASSEPWQDTSMIVPPVSYYDPSDTLEHHHQQDIWQQWDQVTGYPGASGVSPSNYHLQGHNSIDPQHQYPVPTQPSYDSSNQHHTHAASTNMAYRFGVQNTYQSTYPQYQQPPSGTSEAAQRFEEYYRRSDPVQVRSRQINAPIQRIQPPSQQHIAHIVPPRALAVSQIQHQHQRAASSQAQRNEGHQRFIGPASSFTFQPPQTSSHPSADQYYPSADPLQAQSHGGAEGGFYWSQQAVRAKSISPSVGAPGSATASSFPGSAPGSNTHSPPSSYPSTNTPTSTSTTTTATTDTASSGSLSAAQGPPQRASAPVPSESGFVMGHVSHSSADTVRPTPAAAASTGRYPPSGAMRRPSSQTAQRARRIAPTSNEAAQASGSGAPKRGKAAAGGNRTNKRRREAKAAWDDGEGSDGSDEDDDEEDERDGKKGADTKRCVVSSNFPRLCISVLTGMFVIFSINPLHKTCWIVTVSFGLGRALASGEFGRPSPRSIDYGRHRAVDASSSLRFWDLDLGPAPLPRSYCLS